MRQTTLALLLLSCVVGVHAAPPTEASIDTMLVLTKSESVVDSMLAHMEGNMRQSMVQSLQGKTPTPEQQRQLVDFPKQFMAAMKDELAWAKLKPMYVRIYQESLTQEEVDGMTAFYRSPAGEAMVHKMPVVAQKTMQELQPLIQGMVQKAQAIVEKSRADARRTP
jgi:hypothetical protein